MQYVIRFASEKDNSSCRVTSAMEDGKWGRQEGLVSIPWCWTLNNPKVLGLELEIPLHSDFGGSLRDRTKSPSWFHVHISRHKGGIFLEIQPGILIKEKRALGKACLECCGKPLDSGRNWKKVKVICHSANPNIPGSIFLSMTPTSHHSGHSSLDNEDLPSYLYSFPDFTIYFQRMFHPILTTSS